ncbi:MAG: sigma-70 family RNA polymerase sigma factor [Mucispirillum sp.]|uniref:RNA polymerase sigma factor n=1 Tax=Candidatus Mucispirillum faecigallinarum TaxID=2838699 RepID=A0A9D2KD43_9BACT|nr:sigma-70 family RNA polymerase sigma factor [Mucispirillum sp.]HIZ90427.1 sigma-70 family RNA polymerase sigma factor [Candidatus Mucispirillum faecigallinarum]
MLDKEIILKTCKPYLKDNTISIKDFNNLYGMLNTTKKNIILDILVENNITLIDENNKIITNIEQDIEDKFISNFDTFLEISKTKKEENNNEDNESDSHSSNEEVENDEETPRIYELKNKQYKILNKTLCTLVQKGKQEAKEMICKKNMNLVYNIARKYLNYYNHKLEIDDLFQAGMMGLLKAAEKYDKKINTAFSTYATFWIKQSIIRTILDTGLEIRIPVHMIETINKVMRESFLLDEKNYNNNEIIAEKLSIPVETVNKSKYLFDCILNTASLDDELGYEDTSTLKDVIADKKAQMPEKIMLEHKLYKYLIKILDELSLRERTIILYRFGLKRDNQTLEEIGKKYGLTRERIRQIEAKVLKKLKAKAKKLKLEDYIDGK